MAGPSKSEFSEAEETRKAFKHSMTGDDNMEDTVKKIRQKVKEVRFQFDFSPDSLISNVAS